MQTISLAPDTEALARRLVWFEEPSEALSDPIRFVACALARATHEDMKILRAFVTDDDLREALDQAPPGIIDPRSWAYWNSKLGRYPAPPLHPSSGEDGHPSAACMAAKLPFASGLPCHLQFNFAHGDSLGQLMSQITQRVCADCLGSFVGLPEHEPIGPLMGFHLKLKLAQSAS